MKDTLISYALQWVGYLEKKSNAYLENFTKNAGDKNYTIFAKRYNDYFGENYQAQPWCAMFVSVCFYDVFCTKDVVNPFHYCPTGVNFFKNNKRWYSKPQKGDVIFFTNGTRAYHVGIVYNVDSKYVYTVEGNTSNESGVIENGGCVAKKKYSLGYSKILGYGRPFYEKVEEEMKEEIKQLNDALWTTNQNVATLQEKTTKLNNMLWSANQNIEAIQKDMNMVYNYIDETMPEWARPTIQKLVDRGLLKGNEKGELNLDMLMLRILVINDRTGMYDEKQ